MANIITVNGTSFGLDEAAGRSAVIGGPDLESFAIEQLVIAQMATAHGFEVNDDEISETFRELRYIRRLESGEALKQWMTDNSLDSATVWAACEQMILRRKLRDSISDAEITGVYAEERPSYDRAEIYRICVEDQDAANELRALVEEEDESFSLLAIEHSTDAATARMGGYAGEVSRDDVAGELEAAIFAAEPGDLVGPLKTAEGWQVVLVHALRAIPLEDVASTIRETLFEKMTAPAMRNAMIEKSRS
ncbi:peptidylprolyl isomerase [Hoeflea sp. AS60]|uniref:peptidylprolyl isomerase n=1 Tax=Hoeflea sp. AS60 TaxID=3135780 RepID=UPI00316F6EB5